MRQEMPLIRGDVVIATPNKALLEGLGLILTACVRISTKIRMPEVKSEQIGGDVPGRAAPGLPRFHPFLQ